MIENGLYFVTITNSSGDRDVLNALFRKDQFAAWNDNFSILGKVTSEFYELMITQTSKRNVSFPLLDHEDSYRFCGSTTVIDSGFVLFDIQPLGIKLVAVMNKS